MKTQTRIIRTLASALVQYHIDIQEQMYDTVFHTNEGYIDALCYVLDINNDIVTLPEQKTKTQGEWIAYITKQLTWQMIYYMI